MILSFFLILSGFRFCPAFFCGDQLLVNCFDITNIYINIFDKDVNYRSAHVTKLYIKNLYKQDEVSVTRLQFICGIGLGFASKLQKSMPLMQYA